jgi:hypothetical protein
MPIVIALVALLVVICQAERAVRTATALPSPSPVEVEMVELPSPIVQASISD